MSDQIKHNDNEPNLIFNDEKEILLDHEYDGIQELNNPMPPWWVNGFYFTIFIAIVYFLYYQIPGWGPNQIDEYDSEVAAAMELYGPGPESLPTVSYADLEILSDDASIAAGKAMFMSPANLCVTCHGANAQGLVGPNLTDELWIHGCDLESIMLSIKSGYPTLGMPPYGSGVPLTDEQLQQLASYIISLRGSNPDGAKQADPAREIACTI